MRSALIFALLLLSACTKSDRFAVAANEKNSVPIQVSIEYHERQGVDFRFECGRSSEGWSPPRYWLDRRYDAEPKTEELHISTAAWMRFREALKNAHCERWTYQKIDSSTQRPFWQIWVVYPDIEISGASDDPTKLKDFEPVRKALLELTEGKVGMSR